MRKTLYTLAAVAGLLFIAIPAASAAPVPAGPSTTQHDYWCSDDYTGHFACDFYPSTAGQEFGVSANPSNYPGYTLIYNTSDLMLSNGSNGCLHIVKVGGGNPDYMNIATCNHGDRNQRWSFPNGGLEIKSSGDDACVALSFDVITGFPQGYEMQACNASQSYQNWKWFAPGHAPIRLTAAIVKKAPAFTCVSNTFSIQNNNNFGNLLYDTSQNRVELQNNASLMCANQTTHLISGEINFEGTNLCMTYAGPRTGNPPLGYLDGVTCGNKASQQWTWTSGNQLFNNYTGNSWCLDGPRLTGKPFMEGCNGELAQSWSFNFQ